MKVKGWGATDKGRDELYMSSHGLICGKEMATGPLEGF